MEALLDLVDEGEHGLRRVGRTLRVQLHRARVAVLVPTQLREALQIPEGGGLPQVAVGWQTDSAPTYRLYPRSSFADYLARWLIDAMREYPGPEVS